MHLLCPALVLRPSYAVCAYFPSILCLVGPQRRLLANQTYLDITPQKKMRLWAPKKWVTRSFLPAFDAQNALLVCQCPQALHWGPEIMPEGLIYVPVMKRPLGKRSNCRGGGDAREIKSATGTFDASGKEIS